MTSKIRQFKCPAPCNTYTPLDLSKITKPNMNFVICPKCGKRWDATSLPSCCKVDIRFACSQANKKTLYTIQSFSRS